MDIEESGKQIGEKLFLLLNEEQKNALMQYILEQDFHLKLIALKQAAEVKNILGMKKLTKEVMTVIPDNYLLKEEDELVCYGLYKDFQALWKAF